MIDAAFFWVFAFMTLAGGILTISVRNAVHCAVWLIVSLLGTAGLFLLQKAEFLFAVQIILYIGGIMVLFLFVIMLLDLKVEARRRFQTFGVAAGLILVGALAALAVFSIVNSGLGRGLTPRAEGTTPTLGQMLFTDYLLPFEILSVLLLVAMVGVILLSKKDLR